MTIAENTPSWQTLASLDLSRPQRPHLRMSSAGKCPRAQAYALQGLEESNPPDRHAQNRMNMGHMAEVLIILELERGGWETNHTVLSQSGQLDLNQYQGGMCISGSLTMTERTPRHLISPVGPSWVGTDSAVQRYVHFTLALV